MSSAVPNDTKVCPYCAETIKAAAIKCRYCGSELPSVAAAPSPLFTDGADGAGGGDVPPGGSARRRLRALREPADVDVSTDAAESPTRTVSRTRWWTLVALAVLVAVAGGLATYFSLQRHELEESRDAATAAQVTVEEYLETALSFSYKTLEEDRLAAERIMTPSFRDEYTSVIADVQGEAEESRTQVVAETVAASVVSAEPDRVELLAFVNQTTKRRDLDGPRVDQNRVVVVLERSGDRWLIDSLDAL